jgi:hypothetical protein
VLDEIFAGKGPAGEGLQRRPAPGQAAGKQSAQGRPLGQQARTHLVEPDGELATTLHPPPAEFCRASDVRHVPALLSAEFDADKAKTAYIDCRREGAWLGRRI